MCIYNLIYGFSAKPQGIMTLMAVRADCVCVFMSECSYVGHVESDSRAGH